jgi:mRNA interferase MazF
MARQYVPKRRDLIWLSFSPHAGREMGGRRPALVISEAFYNQKSGLALFCPITSQIKGYPFEVLLPPGLKLAGAVLSDQIKSLDWRAREVKFVDKLPKEEMAEVIENLKEMILILE